MSDFDERLRTALSAEDEKYLEDHLQEENYYLEVFSSLRGAGATMNILAWIGTLLAAGLLIFFLIQAFQAETTREQILFAALAVMLNSAQIALKLWTNMRLNRRALLLEIRKLRLELAK